jgi:hypothetical protein
VPSEFSNSAFEMTVKSFRCHTQVTGKGECR